MKKFTFLVFIALFISGVSFAQIQNGGFEMGPATGNGWIESSTHFITLMCDEASCGTCGGRCLPQAGSWFAWFGGVSEYEEGTMGQPITIANGNTAEISFFVKVAVRGTAPADDYVSISIDGNEIYKVFASDSASLGANYTAITKDISAYTDGSVHALLLRGEANGGSNIIFDSFTMTVDGIPTGVEDILNREKAVVVYPNPANEQINLQFNGGVAGSAVVRIYDMNGALVSVEKIMEINNRLFTMNTSSFATGIYNVEVTNGSTVIRERVNIVH